MADVPPLWLLITLLGLVSLLLLHDSFRDPASALAISPAQEQRDALRRQGGVGVDASNPNNRTELAQLWEAHVAPTINETWAQLGTPDAPAPPPPDAPPPYLTKERETLHARTKIRATHDTDEPCQLPEGTTVVALDGDAVVVGEDSPRQLHLGDLVILPSEGGPFEVHNLPADFAHASPPRAANNGVPTD